jgi:hypothetical protein
MEFFDFEFLFQTFEDFKLVFSFLAPFKRIILPFAAFIIFFIVKDAFLFFRQSKYKSEIEWEMFEIRIPREIEKGPKAMDQFFTSLWTLFNTPSNWKEKYIDGEVTQWFSFEVAGMGGKLHFCVRVPKKLRHSVESMLYAEYPDIEIGNAQDYTAEFPDYFDDLTKIGYDIFGLESKLKFPAPYPINTYMSFEEKGGEERIIDPISFLLEVLNKLRLEERAWIQLIVRPANPEWAKEGEKIMGEIKEKLAPKSKPGPAGIQSFTFSLMTPAEEEKLKAISRKVAKRGFETLIRLMYVAPKDIFDKGMWKNMLAYFNQYSSMYNFFSINANTLTGAKWYKWPFLFPDKRTLAKKRLLWHRYRIRYIPEETAIGRLSDPYRSDTSYNSSISILSTEELATLYHPPTNVVLTAPSLERIESKKVSPPGYIPF